MRKAKIGKFFMGSSIRLLNAFVLFFLLTSFVSAQSRAITGLVTDTYGDPIVGATVIIKGTTNGNMTDADGKFIISNAPETGILTVSFICYKTENLNLTGTINFKLTRKEDHEDLH